MGVLFILKFVISTFMTLRFSCSGRSSTKITTHPMVTTI